MGKYFVSCFLFEGCFGGGETLFLRMADYFRNYGYKAVILTRDRNCISIENQEELVKHKVQIVELRRSGLAISVRDDNLFEKKDCIIGVAFQKKMYEILAGVTKKIGNKKLFFYNIYWGDALLKYGSESNIYRFAMRQYLKGFDSGKAFVTMDPVAREIAANYSRLPIERIPMSLLGVDNKEVKCKNIKKGEKFIVLTVTRLDFPFKGYVLGLVDDFVKLSSIYRNMELRIVGDGEGKEKLLQCLKQYGKEIENIKLLGNVDYDNLSRYYDESNVYVGMGTTLIEAARQGIPSIVANAYQYENSTPGYFEETDSLGYPVTGDFARYVDVEKAKKCTFAELIEKILRMDEIENNKRCEDVRSHFLNNYSMDKMMSFFINDENGKLVKGNIVCDFLRKIAYFKAIITLKK